MKKSLILTISALVIIIIVQSALILNYSNRYINCAEITVKQINDNSYFKSQNNLLQHLYDRCFKISGTRLNEVIVENNKREKISLKFLINKNIKLIYYFNEYSCIACVDEELVTFNKLIEKIGRENAVILVDFSNYKDYYQFQCRNDIKCEIYNTNGCQLGIKIENESLIFTINADLVIGKCFIPIKAMKEKTDDYYNNILETYFSE